MRVLKVIISDTYYARKLLKKSYFLKPKVIPFKLLRQIIDEAMEKQRKRQVKLSGEVFRIDERQNHSSYQLMSYVLNECSPLLTFLKS